MKRFISAVTLGFLASLNACGDDEEENNASCDYAAQTEEIRRAASGISRVANNLEENPSVLTPRSPRPTVELPQ